MCCPAVLFAFAPSDFSPTVAAPPSYRSVNGYCSIIPVPTLPQPKVPVRPHASVVRNVRPPCCEWNLFLLGTCPNSYTRELTLIPPNWSPISLPCTESSAPIACVSLRPLIAVDYPLTSAREPRPDTLYCWLQPKLSSLTLPLLHSQQRRIFESPKQNP